jgi:hypothetical protein
MAIEISPSNRASCRACRKTITKGSLRFGESFQSAFFDGDQTYWYHLDCAVVKRPESVKDAINLYRGNLPNREDLLASLGGATKDSRLSKISRAELAPSAQSKCIQCQKGIEKSGMRPVILIDDDPSFKSTSFIHAKCGGAYTQNHADLSTKLEGFYKSLPNTKCPSCEKTGLSYLDPAKHKTPVEQLACEKCGGMFDLATIDTRKKTAPKKKKKAAAKKPAAKKPAAKKPAAKKPATKKPATKKKVTKKPTKKR